MNIHFIGIGGIGISALAQYYLKTGHKVSGSDLSFSEITESLKKKGIKIHIGKSVEVKLQQTDLVIHSPAVPTDNQELRQARKLGIKCLSYPQALGELTKKYFTIGVSGTHGKTTTTALISVILIKAGLDPTVIIGSKLKEFGNSNFRMGKINFSVNPVRDKSPKATAASLMWISNGVNQRRRLHLNNELPKTFQPPSERLASDQRKSALKTDVLQNSYLIIEADEYKSSFLNYWPKIIVLTNLEYEHPDYFRNFQHYLRVFKEYIGHLSCTFLNKKVQDKSENGFLVANKSDENVTKLINMTYLSRLSPRISRRNHYRETFSIVTYPREQKETKKISKILKIPGEHNVSNALAALTVARLLKIPDKISFKALSEYRGAWRRFEVHNIKFNGKNINIISDYGHHPTQVRATIRAAKEKYPKRKVWIVYQPHQYLRTYYLFKDYVKAFDEADEVVLSEIYAVSGRENKAIMEKLSSKNLKEAIEKRFKRMGKTAKVHFLKDFMEVPEFLKSRLENNDVVILMGAGDIYKLVDRFN